MDSKGFDGFFAPAPANVPTAAPPVAPPVAPPIAPPVAPPVVVPVVPRDEPAVTAPVPPEPPVVDAGLGDEAYARVSVEHDSDAESALLSDLLREMVDRGCSDLHLTAAARPTVRLNGQLMQLTDRPVLTPPMIQRMMYSIITQKQREKFEESLELDYAYALPGKARFRVNLYKQRDSLGVAFRLIPYELKKLEELGLPPAIGDFAALPRGFVLVTGPTGSGKSTTLASLIDLANRTRASTS